MLFTPSLPPPPANVHRVLFTGFKGQLSKDYPQLLHRIIQESDYVEHIKRIEEAVYVPKKFMFLSCLAFLLIIPGVIVGIVTGLFFLIAIFISVSFFLMIVCMCFMIFKLAKKTKKAIEKLEIILNEINQRYYSRGAKWTYTSFRLSEKNHVNYIEITVFSPGSIGAPPIDGVIFTAPISASVYPAAGATYPTGAYPAVPPPAAAAAAPVPVSVPADPAPEAEVNPYLTYANTKAGDGAGTYYGY